MNKFLTLLFLVLLFSFSFCKDCNEDDEGCSKDQIPEDEKDHWKCVSLDDETCELVLLCEHAVKTDDDTTFKCSDYYVEDETEVCTENIGGTTACKAETKCSKVQKPTGEDTVICGAYPVSDKTKAFCTKDESADAEFACKEEEYVCSKVPKSLSSSIQCSDYSVSDERRYYCVSSDSTEFACEEKEYLCNEVPTISGETTIECSLFDVDSTKKDTHICTENTASTSNQCQEIYYCSKVPKPADNEPSIDCSIYYVNENQICIQDLESTTKVCREEYLCNNAESGETNEDCAKYPVQKGHESTHGCIKDSTEGKFCIEASLCSQIELATATDEECAKYPVSFAKINTHVCVKDTDTKCKEQPLCDEVEKTGDDEIDCSAFQVKAVNKDTHLCVKSSNVAKPCSEMKKCALNEDGTDDEECRKYPVTDNTKACIKDPTKLGCKEEVFCTTVTKGDGIVCPNYPVSEDKKNTHICKATDSEKCEEVAYSTINCLEAEKGQTKAQCDKYKVSTGKFCIKNPVITDGATPCIEYQKSECELKDSGATKDEDCSGLAVEKEGEQKCVRDSQGNKCVQYTFCDYGVGDSDTACGNYALKNEEKVCKKKEGENKCEEVEKKENESHTPGEESGDETKTSDKNENVSNTSDKKVDDSTSGNDKVSDKTEINGTGKVDNNGDEIDDSSEANEDNGETGDKKGSGNFLKNAFGLLLMILFI